MDRLIIRDDFGCKLYEVVGGFVYSYTQKKFLINGERDEFLREFENLEKGENVFGVEKWQERD